MSRRRSVALISLTKKDVGSAPIQAMQVQVHRVRRLQPKNIIVYMWLGKDKLFDFVIVHGILIPGTASIASVQHVNGLKKTAGGAHDEDASRIGVKDLNLYSCDTALLFCISWHVLFSALSMAFGPYLHFPIDSTNFGTDS